MSLKSLNPNLSWSSQVHIFNVSHPVMQSFLIVVMPPIIMGPDTQTSWLPGPVPVLIVSEEFALATQPNVPQS